MIGTASPDEKQRASRLLRFLASWESSANRTADRLAAILIRFRYVILAFLSIAYFAATCLLAARKLFWFDEIFTIYLTRLPDLGSLWNALKAGVDFNPPMLYLLTRLAHKFAGEGPIGTRLPEIIGFWIFCLCLCRFVSVRSSPLGGFISFLFPAVTIAYFYAYDARPYGIMLGFSGLALVCWQGAAERTSGRFWWLAGLTGALAGALLSHAYAFLLLVPIGAGELARAVIVRRPDWAVWVAIAVSCTANLTLIPIVHASHSMLVTFPYFKTIFPSLPLVYFEYLKPAAYVLFVCLALVAFSKQKVLANTRTAKSPQPYEVVALLVYVSLPVLQAFAAKATGGPIIARYSIVWLAGPACLLGLTAARRPLVAIGTLAILLAQFGVRTWQLAGATAINEPSGSGAVLSTSLREYRIRYQRMGSLSDKTSPIILLNILDFLPTLFYAPPSLLPRLIYVMPSRSDITGVYYERLQACCASTLAPPLLLSDFRNAHKVFLAFGAPSDLSRLGDLSGEGATITIKAILGEPLLTQVTLPQR